MQKIIEFAPAKLNLYLHITGRRHDGYHDLDSLVGFASIGDWVELTPGQGFSFITEGPQASALSGGEPSDNLVVKAAVSLAELTGYALDVSIKLTKNLPVASGIGGGSSDAAAVLRALARFWGLHADDPRLLLAAARHGQDVPVCLYPKNLYMTAAGTAPAPQMPEMGIILINPNKPLSTPAAYKAYRDSGQDFSPAAPIEQILASPYELGEMLKQRQNDFYTVACQLMPEIAAMVKALEQTSSCLLARMSGSGATCFGLYADIADAHQAASQILSRHPQWWVQAGLINKAF